MNDPSNGVPKPLVSCATLISLPLADLPQLPHVHLVSTYKFPFLPQINNDAMVDNLLRAPHITKEVAPMLWTFLDSPPDGTVMLVWQPLAQLGTKFASDGYIYADAEEVFTHQHRGYVCAFCFQREVVQ